MEIKVIFLDIDGVLWTVAGDQLAQKLKIRHGDHRELDPTRVILLERIIQRHPELRVVVSSTWRLGRSIEELAEILGPVIGPRIIGKTVSMRDKNHRSVQRSREILHWLKNTTEKVTDYIVLDDDADMQGVASRWWKCDCYDGMSARTAFALEEYLKSDTNSFYARKKRLTNWFKWFTIIVKYHCYYQWSRPIQWRIRGWLQSLEKRRKGNTN